MVTGDLDLCEDVVSLLNRRVKRVAAVWESVRLPLRRD
jgi:hypothetical protein